MSGAPLLLWSAPPCHLRPHSEPVSLDSTVGRLASSIWGWSMSLRSNPLQSRVLADLLSWHLYCSSGRSTEWNERKTVRIRNWVATLWLPHTPWSHIWGELCTDQEWLTGSSWVPWTMWSNTCAVLACLDCRLCWSWSIPLGRASWSCPSVMPLQ